MNKIDGDEVVGCLGMWFGICLIAVAATSGLFFFVLRAIVWFKWALR